MSGISESVIQRKTPSAANIEARNSRRTMPTLPSAPLQQKSGLLFPTEMIEEEKFAVDILCGESIQQILVINKQCCKRMCLHTLIPLDEPSKYNLGPVIALIQACRRQLIGKYNKTNVAEYYIIVLYCISLSFRGKPGTTLRDRQERLQDIHSKCQVSIVGESGRAKVGYVLSTGDNKVLDEQLKKKHVCAKAFGHVYQLSRKQRQTMLNRWKNG
jgi:hypothetical protein